MGSKKRKVDDVTSVDSDILAKKEKKRLKKEKKAAKKAAKKADSGAEDSRSDKSKSPSKKDKKKKSKKDKQSKKSLDIDGNDVGDDEKAREAAANPFIEYKPESAEQEYPRWHSFDALNDKLPEWLIKGACGTFDKPSNVQSTTWPLAFDGKDVIGVARTGSGKVNNNNTCFVSIVVLLFDLFSIIIIIIL
jgi:ATP-dependent RNA helicase DBP3